MPRLHLMVGLFLISISACAQSPKATTTAISAATQTAFHQWRIDFAKHAANKGIEQSTLDTFVANTSYVPKVIALDRKQPDSTKTFDEYLKIVVPASRIKYAQTQYKKHYDLLHVIGKKYNVQPRFIVALWAIESDFGRNMGSFNIIDALATLAYEGRRADFFKQELINALHMIDQDHFLMQDMKGSWAGAMGQTQFMPSSFLSLAVDYNKDGKRDIWQTPEDVFASIANYLSSHRWNSNQTWGREVKLPTSFDANLLSKETTKSISDWKKLGVTQADGTPLVEVPGLAASIIRPNKNHAKSYMIYPNYKVLLKWNRSLYFATAVGILADKIQ